MKREVYDSIIVGGGFYGLYLAEFLALHGRSVLLCEREAECMTHASYNNQARVHSGYHYPRSWLTALRSCESFPRFTAEFPDAVVRDFDKYYAIGRILGKVTAAQFLNFCRRIGAPCELVAPKTASLFDPHYIEAVFSTREFAFDAAVLRRIMLERTAAAGVEVCTGTDVLTARQAGKGGLEVEVKQPGGGPCVLRCRNLYNCTYSRINALNMASGLPAVPLKHEMTEMALVDIPEEIRGMGITVMCGPFFSIMPFPDRGLHTLSHVRYTPHYEWTDAAGLRQDDYVDAHKVLHADPRRSAYPEMMRDAARYMPCLRKMTYRDSLWEVKTVLPASEVDDSRPILFKPDYHLKGYHIITGGKIDNIYDCIQRVAELERIPLP